MNPARKANTVNPTKDTYNGFDSAYDYFNHVLFDNSLPRCLVTLQRKANTYGYFGGKRFGTVDGSDVRDEIALNPTHFKDRTATETLSTLAHEMAHLWQAHFGTLPRAGYHDKEWAAKMKDIGLHPSTTGAPGGKETGQQCSHYIVEGGPFAEAAARLIAKGWKVPYVSLWDEDTKKTAAKKKASKTKFTCGCCGQAAWGKPTLKIVCGDCDEEMVGETPADADAPDAGQIAADTAPELSPKAAEILAALRRHGESLSVDADGSRWYSVYLDNARPDGMSARSFAGYLSALERAGLYRSLGDDAFGDVLADD